MPKTFKWYYGTKAGGLKCAKTNRERHGKDYYARIGRRGGMNSSTGGFASKIVGPDGLTGSQRARIAGAKGGSISKRGKATRPRKDKGVKRKPVEMPNPPEEPKKKSWWPWSK